MATQTPRVLGSKAALQIPCRTGSAAAVDECEAVHEVRHEVDGVLVLHADDHVLHPRVVLLLNGRHLRNGTASVRRACMLAIMSDLAHEDGCEVCVSL